MYSYGPTHTAKQKQDDQLKPTYSSSVRIQDVALRTCQKQWTIGRSGGRGSGISVLAARHGDDDDGYVSLFNGISTFVVHLMPKPFLQKNSSDIILLTAGYIRGFIHFPKALAQKRMQQHDWSWNSLISRLQSSTFAIMPCGLPPTKQRMEGGPMV